MTKNDKWSERLQNINKVVINTMKFISYLSMISLLIIALLASTDVFASKLFRSGIANATELITYLNIPVVFLSIAYVQLDRGHTYIDLFFLHFPKIIQKIIRTIGNLLGITISLFIGWRAIILTLNKMSNGTKGSGAASSFSIWPFVSIIAIGFILLALAFVWSIVKEWLNNYTVNTTIDT